MGKAKCCSLGVGRRDGRRGDVVPVVVVGEERGGFVGHCGQIVDVNVNECGRGWVLGFGFWVLVLGEWFW